MLPHRVGFIALKKDAAHGGIDVEDDEHHQGDVTHARDGIEKGAQEHPQLGDDGDQAQHPEDAQQAAEQGHLTLGHRDQAGSDDDEIEHIPALRKEIPQAPLRQQADDNLCQEKEGDGPVQYLEYPGHLGIDRVGLGADHQGAEHDDQDDEGLEDLVVADGDESVLNRCE